jgi:hypothetical protein
MFSCSSPVGIVGVVTPCVKVGWPGVGTEVETVSLPYNTSRIKRLDQASSICYNDTQLQNKLQISPKKYLAWGSNIWTDEDEAYSVC